MLRGAVVLACWAIGLSRLSGFNAEFATRLIGIGHQRVQSHQMPGGLSPGSKPSFEARYEPRQHSALGIGKIVHYKGLTTSLRLFEGLL